MIRFLFAGCLLFSAGFADGQSVRYLPNRYTVYSGTDTIQFPFLGGFNAPRIQWSSIPDPNQSNLFVLDVDEFFRFIKENQTFRFYQPTFSEKVTNWFLLQDLNGDGNPDLITSDSTGQAIWFPALEGDFQFPATFGPLPTADNEPIVTDGLSQPDFFDYDADGDVDFFSGLPFGSVLFYENTGTGKNPSFTYRTDRFGGILVLQDTVLIDPTVLRKPLHGASAVTLTDYDSDGDADLFFGDFFSRSLYRFTNISSDLKNPAFSWEPGAFPVTDPVITDGYNQAVFLTSGTQQELFVTSNITTATIDNFWHFVNEGTPESPDYRLRTKNYLKTIDLGRRSGVSFADLNMDGKPDLLAGSESGFLNAWVQQADSSFRFQSGRFAFQTAIPGCHPSVFDDNKDGKPDLFVGSFDGKIRFFRNIGLPSVPVFSEEPSRVPLFDAGSYSIPIATDLNSDGLTDLLVGSSNGRIFLLHGAAGNSWLPADTLISTGDFRSVAPYLLFWDNDTIPDLAVSEDNGNLSIYRGTLTGSVFGIDSVLLRIKIPVKGFTIASMKKTDDQTLQFLGGASRGGIVCFNIQLKTNPEPRPPINNKMVLFPNPASHSITIQWPVSGPFDGFISSVTGQRIQSFSGVGSAIHIQTAHLASGLYLVSVRSSGKFSHGKFVVIH